MKDRIMKYTGVVAMIFGLCVLIFTATGIRALGNHGIWFLDKSYGPNAPADSRTYENLYGWTDNLLRQRNAYATRFYATLGGATVIIGVLLIWHSKERKK